MVEIQNRMIYAYSQAITAVLTQVSGSGANIDAMSDTRKQAGATSQSSTAFVAEGTTAEPGTVTVAYDKINLAYIGLPKWIHDQDHFPEYVSSVRQDSQKCAVPRSIAELNDKEYAIVNDTTCNDIDCQMKDKCSYWNNVVNASEERIANIAVLSSFDIYTSLMNYIDVSDVNVENTVQDTLEDEIEIEETLQAAEECTDDNLTDEQRALRWVQQTIERRNR